jgi:predicted transcriptional regulator
MSEGITTKEENPFKGYIPPKSSDDEGIENYIQLFDELKEINDDIIDLEKQLVKKMMKKNDLMEKVDNLMEERVELNFHQRIMLRAIACLGPDCVKDLPALLNLERVMVDHYLDILTSKNWLVAE